jgi:hypothetical protein
VSGPDANRPWLTGSRQPSDGSGGAEISGVSGQNQTPRN